MTRPAPLSLLYAAQAVAAVGMAAGGTAGGLLAVDLTGDHGAVVLPLGALVLGATAAVPPVSAAMRRRDRRSGLLLGLVVAVLGALVVLVGAHLRLFTPVLVGHALLGAGNTAVMFGRYVAADLVPSGAGATPRRATAAVAGALTAASVGAVLGPNLLAPAGRLADGAGLPVSAGLYALAVPAFAAAALLVLRLPAGRPDHLAADAAASDRAGRAPRHLPLAVPVLLGVANATMVTMMAVMPPALHHHGWHLPAVGLVVSVHVAAMFGFSPVSGWLCARYPVPAVAAGGAVLAAVTAVAAGLLAEPSGTAAGVAVALIALGVAWNVQLVSGTILLIAGLRAADRHRGEAAGEVVMGLGAAAGTLSAAPLLTYAGLGGLGVCAAVLSLVAAMVVVRARGRTDSGAGPARDPLTEMEPTR